MIDFKIKCLDITTYTKTPMNGMKPSELCKNSTKLWFSVNTSIKFTFCTTNFDV